AAPCLGRCAPTEPAPPAPLESTDEIPSAIPHLPVLLGLRRPRLLAASWVGCRLRSRCRRNGRAGLVPRGERGRIQPGCTPVLRMRDAAARREPAEHPDPRLP